MRWEAGKLSKGVRPVEYGGVCPKRAVYTRTKGQVAYGPKIDAVVWSLQMPRAWMSERFQFPRVTGRDGKVKRRPNWFWPVREYILPELEERFGEVPSKWPKKDVIEVAMRELAQMDRWAGGWPEGALKWLFAPGWRELGFDSYDDYVASAISMDLPSVAMPPPVQGKPKRASKTVSEAKMK